KSGTWMSFGGERMGQGRENVRVFLKENKDIRDKIENTLRKKMEIPFAGHAGEMPGVNGHGTNGAEKAVPVKAAAAAAADAKGRPAR
ncbi:MAG TPA: hypothetical protein VGH37_08925, partial [Candidatus Acidoferrum sp.]